MGMTLTEKILARHTGKGDVSPGDNIWVDVDVLMTHDVCGPGTIEIFKREFGTHAKVWDRDKVVIIPDHYIFTEDVYARGNIDILCVDIGARGNFHPVRVPPLLIGPELPFEYLYGAWAAHIMGHQNIHIHPDVISRGDIPFPGMPCQYLLCQSHSHNTIAGDRFQICPLSLYASLFKAFKYALALATIMSVSAPCPTTVLPPSSIRTVTSPRASVPPVMALTSYDRRRPAACVMALIVRYVASTGPSPVETFLTLRPSISSSTVAVGVTSLPLST